MSDRVRGVSLKSFAMGLSGLLLFASTIGLQIDIDRFRTGLGVSNNGMRSSASTTLQFLGGLRSATAAYLWLKVDRLHDDYYGERLEDEEELVPFYRIITWLDPSFTDAYYVGSYLLYKFDRPEEGWKFALEGLRLNPGSSKMERNVGELALFYRKDPKNAIPHLKKAFSMAQEEEERMLSLQALRGAYMQSGMSEKARGLDGAIKLLEGRAGTAEQIIQNLNEHDHDHDGVPDHTPGDHENEQ